MLVVPRTLTLNKQTGWLEQQHRRLGKQQLQPASPAPPAKPLKLQAAMPLPPKNSRNWMTV